MRKALVLVLLLALPVLSIAAAKGAYDNSRPIHNQPPDAAGMFCLDTDGSIQCGAFEAFHLITETYILLSPVDEWRPPAEGTNVVMVTASRANKNKLSLSIENSGYLTLVTHIAPNLSPWFLWTPGLAEVKWVPLRDGRIQLFIIPR